ncbi:hypothetical protein VLF92_07270 [Pseudomonas chengduensis]
MNYLARVNPLYFAALHRAAGDGGVRYWLNSVHIERHQSEGVILVATNGRVMAAMHDPEGWLHPDRATLTVQRTNKRVLSAISKRPSKGGLSPKSLWIGESCLVLSANEDTSEEPEPFGPFSLVAERSALVVDHEPLNWRRPIPKGEDTAAPWLNPQYLALFSDIAQVLFPSKYCPGGGMRLIASGENGAVLVRLAAPDLVERFLGVIMPIRNDTLNSPHPAFLKLNEGVSPC